MYIYKIYTKLKTSYERTISPNDLSVKVNWVTFDQTSKALSVSCRTSDCGKSGV